MSIVEKESLFAFICHDLKDDNTRLQPWRTFLEHASNLSKNKNCKIKIISLFKGSDQPINNKICNLDVKHIKLDKNYKQELFNFINDNCLEHCFISATSLSAFDYFFYKKISNTCNISIFLTGPIYSNLEVLRAIFSGVKLSEIKSIALQTIIPRILFKSFLNSKVISNIFVISKGNYRKLYEIGCKREKIEFLPCSIDEELLNFGSLSKSDRFPKSEEIKFIYFGSLKAIRGFNTLIKSIDLVLKNHSNISFTFLARGASKEEIDLITNQYTFLKSKYVNFIGGWLEKSEVFDKVNKSDVAILPFVLVPSDVPIAILEAMALGKPIITSNIAGLKYIVEDCGLLSKPGNSIDLADQIIKMVQNHELRENFKKNSINYINKLPSWNQSTKLLAKKVF